MTRGGAQVVLLQALSITELTAGWAAGGARGRAGLRREGEVFVGDEALQLEERLWAVRPMWGGGRGRDTRLWCFCALSAQRDSGGF